MPETDATLEDPDGTPEAAIHASTADAMKTMADAMAQAEKNRAEDLRIANERYTEEARLRNEADLRAKAAADDSSRAAQQQFDLIKAFMASNQTNSDGLKEMLKDRGEADKAIVGQIAGDSKTQYDGAKGYMDVELPTIKDPAAFPETFKWDELKPSLVGDKIQRAMEWRRMYQRLVDWLHKAGPIMAREARAPITKMKFSKLKFDNLDTSKAPGSQKQYADGMPHTMQHRLRLAKFQSSAARDKMADHAYKMVLYTIADVCSLHAFEQQGKQAGIIGPAVAWTPSKYSDTITEASARAQFALGHGPLFLPQSTADRANKINLLAVKIGWEHTYWKDDLDRLQVEVLTVVEQSLAAALRDMLVNDDLRRTCEQLRNQQLRHTVPGLDVTREGTAILHMLDKRFDTTGRFSAIMIIMKELKIGNTGSLDTDMAQIESYAAELKLFFMKPDGITFDQPAFDRAKGIAQVLHSIGPQDRECYKECLQLIQLNSPSAAGKEELMDYIRGRDTGLDLHTDTKHEAYMSYAKSRGAILPGQQQAAPPAHTAYAALTGPAGVPAQAFMSAPPPMQHHSAYMVSGMHGGGNMSVAAGDLVYMASQPGYGAHDGSDEFAFSANVRRKACTNCDTMEGRDAQPHDPLDCPGSCRMCKDPPGRHKGPPEVPFHLRCIRFDAWQRLTQPAVRNLFDASQFRSQPRQPPPTGGYTADRSGGKGNGGRGGRKPTRLRQTAAEAQVMQVTEWDLELVRIDSELNKHWDDGDRRSNIEHSAESAYLMREELVLRLNRDLPDDGLGGAGF